MKIFASVLLLVTSLLSINIIAKEINSKEKYIYTGSTSCKRCHAGIFELWKNREDKKSCESCHGAGKNHILAPTTTNIIKNDSSGYIHGYADTKIKSMPKDSAFVELFIMSYCPYGVDALNSLLPVITKLKSNINFRLNFIAHKRNNKQIKKDASNPNMESSGKCESSGDMDEGTDKFVSLHGLEEVLEDLRAVIIADKYPDKLLKYLSKRYKKIDSNWKKSAYSAGFSKEDILEIEDLTDSNYGDSLFEKNISVAEARKISGSPTLFINGLEFNGAISPYAIQRTICLDNEKTKVCKEFPKCGYDFDCKKAGMSGICLNPMSKKAKCVYKKAVPFTVTVINDEDCETCHTGNLIAEIVKRFPSVQFKFVDINSKSGKALINKYSLTIYPSFIFDTTALLSDKFREIKHTFVKRKDKFIIKQSIIKSYHFLNREEIPNQIDIFGSFQSPPFVETVRAFESILNDTTLKFTLNIHPFVAKRDSLEQDIYKAYIAPYGKNELTASVRQLCVSKLYPKKVGFDFKLCRGFDVQKRFAGRIMEEDSEWETCAEQLKIDKKRVESCVNSVEGRELLDKSITLMNKLGIKKPIPSILINNIFKIEGYNPAVKQVILKELQR